MAADVSTHADDQTNGKNLFTAFFVPSVRLLSILIILMCSPFFVVCFSKEHYSTKTTVEKKYIENP